MVGKFTGGDSERLCPNNRTYLVFVLRYYVSVSFQQDFTFLRVGKGIFVNRELLVLFPVKESMYIKWKKPDLYRQAKQINLTFSLQMRVNAAINFVIITITKFSNLIGYQLP